MLTFLSARWASKYAEANSNDRRKYQSSVDSSRQNLTISPYLFGLQKNGWWVPLSRDAYERTPDKRMWPPGSRPNILLVADQVGQWLMVGLGLSYEDAGRYGAALCAQGLYTSTSVLDLGAIELDTVLREKVNCLVVRSLLRTEALFRHLALFLTMVLKLPNQM